MEKKIVKSGFSSVWFDIRTWFLRNQFTHTPPKLPVFIDLVDRKAFVYTGILAGVFSRDRQKNGPAQREKTPRNPTSGSIKVESL